MVLFGSMLTETVARNCGDDGQWLDPTPPLNTSWNVNYLSCLSGNMVRFLYSDTLPTDVRSLAGVICIW